MAIKEIFGKEKPVKLVWHYLAHNKKITSKRTNEQLEELKQKTLELIKNIEATKDFPPKKSTLCSWCEYKYICPAWGNSPENPAVEEKPSDLDDYPFLKKYIKDSSENNAQVSENN